MSFACFSHKVYGQDGWDVEAFLVVYKLSEGHCKLFLHPRMGARFAL